MFVNAVSLTPHTRFLLSKIDHISANSKQNSKRLSVNRGPRWYCLMKKIEGRKSRDTVPFSENQYCQYILLEENWWIFSSKAKSSVVTDWQFVLKITFLYPKMSRFCGKFESTWAKNGKIFFICDKIQNAKPLSFLYFALKMHTLQKPSFFAKGTKI
jgi:hypothetical protein